MNSQSNKQTSSANRCVNAGALATRFVAGTIRCDHCGGIVALESRNGWAWLPLHPVEIVDEPSAAEQEAMGVRPAFDPLFSSVSNPKE